ncbi:putative coiled coil-containing protein [Cryptosporidium canis]|uniref:Coiled coil-containing protein n=1 Tax=Cryptosporidium canis TaxID=195482 RepID=A0A9D5HXM9_9CRYT|nr:putative coiled coil-containing protein [Cryptosporidium canis]
MSQVKNNVRGEVVLPLLELSKVKERFKDDNSVQIMNESFNKDNLGSSSSNRSSQFSSNLSIPQEPKPNMNKLTSINYDDLSINQIKNRLLKKKCFSLVPIIQNTDEDDEIKYSNSLMNIDDYFKERMRHNFELSGEKQKVNLEGKGGYSPKVSSNNKKGNSPKKLMNVVKSKLQSLIRSHDEDEQELTFKSSINKSESNSGRNMQESKGKIPDLNYSKSSSDSMKLEKVGTKLISANDSSNNKPIFSKKVTLNMATMLKSKSLNSRELEKNDMTPNDRLNFGSKSSSKVSIVAEKNNKCQLIKMESKNSNKATVIEQESNPIIVEKNEQSIQKVNTSEKCDTGTKDVLKNKNSSLEILKKDIPSKISSDSKLSGNMKKLMDELKGRHGNLNEESLNNHELKSELNSDEEATVHCLVEENKEISSKGIDEKHSNTPELKDHYKLDESRKFDVHKDMITNKEHSEDSKGDELNKNNTLCQDKTNLDGHDNNYEECPNEKNKEVHGIETAINKIKASEDHNLEERSEQIQDEKIINSNQSEDVSGVNNEEDIKYLVNVKLSDSKEECVYTGVLCPTDTIKLNETLNTDVIVCTNTLLQEKLVDDQIIKNKVTQEELKNENHIKPVNSKMEKDLTIKMESIDKTNIQSNLGEYSDNHYSNINSKFGGESKTCEIKLKDELRDKLDERENLKNVPQENELTLNDKNNIGPPNDELSILKQDNKQRSTTISDSLCSQSHEVMINKVEPKKDLEQNKNLKSDRLLCLKKAENNKPVECTKFSNPNINPKINKQNPIIHLKENIQSEIKASTDKTTVKEQNRDSIGIHELCSTNINKLEGDRNHELDSTLKVQKNVQFIEFEKQKNCDKTNKLVTESTKLSEEDSNNGYQIKLSKKDSSLSNKQPQTTIFKEESKKTKNCGLKSSSVDSPQNKKSLINNSKCNSKIKTNSLSIIDKLSLTNHSEKNNQLPLQKPVDKVSKELMDADAPKITDSKDVLKGKWCEIIKDKEMSKIFSSRKKSEQPKMSNEYKNKKMVNLVKQTELDSSINKNNSETNDLFKVDKKEMISGASLKKIITLEDCIPSETINKKNNQVPAENILLGSDYSISFKGDSTKKTLLNSKKREELRNHLAAPVMQYRIYSDTSKFGLNNYLINSETKHDESESSNILFSPFMGILNKICDIFNSHGENNDFEIKTNTCINRANSVEFQLKQFQEKDHFKEKNPSLLFGSKKNELSVLVEQNAEDNQFLLDRKKNTKKEQISAVQKLLSSDFSCVEQNNDTYRRSYTLNKLKIEGNNSGKAIRRVPRKKIANRNIHTVELNKICIRSPKKEGGEKSTNKTLKINLMENVLRTEHQVHSVRALNSGKLARERSIFQESEVGTSTINKYEDFYLKNRARRNYLRLLKNYVSLVEDKNSIAGSGCSCHFCSRHSIGDSKIDPITLHIISEENKLREIRNNSTIVNKNEGQKNGCNLPKHYHKHYHIYGTKQLKLEKKHKKSSCRHKSICRSKHRCKHHERDHRSKSKKSELNLTEHHVASEDVQLHQDLNRTNNIYSSNDFAQLKGKIELILREYGVIDKIQKQEMNPGAQSPNFSIEASEISALKSVLLDTNKLLSQNLRDKKQLKPSISDEKLSEVDISKRENVAFQGKQYIDDAKEKTNWTKQIEIMKLPTNNLERAIMHRNMMQMKLDLDCIRKDESNKIMNNKTMRRLSKNGQRIAKGRRSVPNISKTNDSSENQNLNSQGSFKTVKKTILKSSKQQSNTNNQNNSWFSGWFGHYTPNKVGEITNPTKDNSVDSQLDSGKELGLSSQFPAKSSAPNNNSSPKAKHANFPPPPVQNEYAENKFGSRSYKNSSKSDARATKATSNDNESLDLNDFIDYSDFDVSTKNNQEENKSNENCTSKAELVDKIDSQTKEQESSFWGWFGYSSQAEKPVAKTKTVKSAQKNINKNNQQKLKRKSSKKLPQENVNVDKDNSGSQNASSLPPPQETSWFSSWFGGSTQSPPPPPPTPATKPKGTPTQKWSPPPPLEPTENSPSVQTPEQTSYYQEAQQPSPPPPTPAPVGETSWFSSWFGGATDTTEKTNLQDKNKKEQANPTGKSSAKSKHSRIDNENKAGQAPTDRLPSIKVSPAPNSNPPAEGTSWFSGWFGGSETTPAPPPTPVVTQNPEQTNIPVSISQEVPIPSPPPPQEESSWFSSWFTTTPDPSPKPTPKSSPKKPNPKSSDGKGNTKLKEGRNDQTNSAPVIEKMSEPMKASMNESMLVPNSVPQAPVAEESSWFSGWFGGADTTPAPPPTPTVVTGTDYGIPPKSDQAIAPSSSNQPEPIVEESSWFSGWFRGSETTPAPPPTPTVVIKPEAEQIPKNNSTNVPVPVADESSWFSGWFGGSETTPAPPPTPTVTRTEPGQTPKSGPKKAPDPSQAPSPSPVQAPAAEESSWFSGWFGGSETTPAPPPTPTVTAKTEPRQIPKSDSKKDPAPAQTNAPAPVAEESSWFSGWFGGSETTPAPPPTPTVTAKTEPRQIPSSGPKKALAPVAPPVPTNTPAPVAEESSWFSGWFGGSEATPAPPPTPTAAEGTVQSNNTATNTLQVPSPSTVTKPTQPTEESSWFGGWLGGSSEATPPAPPPAPPPSPSGTQESSWFSGFGW